MGAWGHGAFDNDTACDWAYELEQASDLSLVDIALQNVLFVGKDYLDSDVANQAHNAKPVNLLLNEGVAREVTARAASRDEQ